MHQTGEEYRTCFRESKFEIAQMIWREGISETVAYLNEVLSRWRRRKGPRSEGEQGSYDAVLKFCNRHDPELAYTLDYPEEEP